MPGQVNTRRKQLGFTIVELLVVIVVIGILAAITIVSYTGITKKANESAIKSEITNASKKLSMYYAEYGSYPTTAGLGSSTNWCPTAPNNDTNYCIKFNSGTVVTYTSSSSTSFELTFARNNLMYRITDGNAPYSITPEPITAIGAITGTAEVGSTLTAGALTPAIATASYQWQSATTSNGTYANISGATNSTYVLTATEETKYLKVIATGTGIYTGTQTSAISSQIAASPWITIGSQRWAKANLNVGTRINGSLDQTNNGGTNIVEKWCVGDSESGCTTYGGLYRWDEAMNYSTNEASQGICPIGSHIPSDNEWKILEVSLGMTQAQADLENAYRGTNQGYRLRIGGDSNLNIPFAGNRNGGTFQLTNGNAFLWTSTELGAKAWNRALDPATAGVDRYYNDKVLGFSVRCLGN